MSAALSRYFWLCMVINQFKSAADVLNNTTKLGFNTGSIKNSSIALTYCHSHTSKDKKLLCKDSKRMTLGLILTDNCKNSF